MKDKYIIPTLIQYTRLATKGILHTCRKRQTPKNLVPKMIGSLLPEVGGNLLLNQSQTKIHQVPAAGKEIH